MADNTGRQGQSPGVMFRQYCHLGYFRTKEGIGKLIEWVVVLLGLIIMSSVGASSAGPVEFFIFVHTTAWIFLTVHILLRLLNIYHRLPNILITHQLHMILTAIAVLMFLICSAIVLGKYSGYSKTDAAGAFGLIAMFLFGFECFYHFYMWRNADTTSQTEMKQEASNKEGDIAEPSTEPDY